tara:strand:- start:2744 stop:3412 length:669 start_codon:yes stop_codon:yes gene_type:complete
MKEVVLDTETTGLSVKDGHRIVEIGAIELDNLIPTRKIFHVYLNPERKVSQEAFKVHGYSDQFLSDKKKFNEISDDFLAFIKDKKIIIHNAEFDIAHINNELLLAGKEKISKTNVVDTLDIARNKFPGSSINLDALCKKFRIDSSRRTKHTALIDCELLSKVYINLIDQKEPMLDLKSEVNSKLNLENNASSDYYKKIIYPSNEEKKLHKNFIVKNLKKSFF